MTDNIAETHVGRLRRVKTADLLLAISECTRQDFIEHLGVSPDRIVTIGTGVSENFGLPVDGEEPMDIVRRAYPVITRPFVMSVPAFEWRKNAGALIRAFARTTAARRETQLVIACAVSPQGEAAWRALAHECGLADDDLVITGYVGDATLRSLYQATRLFVFPSRYEGFGLPVAEAARCGAACITSDRGSLTEVLDLPASTFDPENVDQIADMIDRGLEDAAFRGQLLAAGARSAEVHTWDHVAERSLVAYSRLDDVSLHRSPSRPVRRRPRLAVVGPMPPVPSGAAVYTERVLAALDPDRFEIEIYAESVPLESWPPKVDGHRVFPAATLGTITNPYDYDAVLYCLGTSRFHIDTLERCRQFPGIVWLHDANVMGLYLEWAARTQWELRYGWRGERATRSIGQILHDEAVIAYGESGLNELPDSIDGYQEYVASGITFVAPSIVRARHVIVNSALAAARVVEDYARSRYESPLPAMSQVPHAVPTLGFDNNASSMPGATPTVVSLGFCVPRKRPQVIVEAIAQLAQRVELVFVGSCAPALEREIQSIAARLGVADRVRITGYVDESEYRMWLQRAHCAVQLRDIDFGESTGTVHDAIAAQVPVITSVSSCRELPEGTVVNVDPSITADALAVHLKSVLFDDRNRSQLIGAMATYAESWTFANVADRFAEIVEASIPEASRAYVR
jgi:glycosyltransferase involved in cell wall biosynthesis